MESFFFSMPSVTEGTHVEVLVKQNTVNVCRYGNKREFKKLGVNSCLSMVRCEIVASYLRESSWSTASVIDGEITSARGKKKLNPVNFFSNLTFCSPLLSSHC